MDLVPNLPGMSLGNGVVVGLPVYEKVSPAKSKKNKFPFKV